LGELFFAFGEKLAGAEEDFSALGGGDETPGFEGFFGGGYCFVYVFRGRGREDADDVGVVGGIDVFKSLATVGRQPFAADQIAIVFRGHAISLYLSADARLRRLSRTADSGEWGQPFSLSQLSNARFRARQGATRQQFETNSPRNA